MNKSHSERGFERAQELWTTVDFEVTGKIMWERKELPAGATLPYGYTEIFHQPSVVRDLEPTAHRRTKIPQRADAMNVKDKPRLPAFPHLLSIFLLISY